MELQTILLDHYPCLTSPCIDPVFGPTVASSYWSATTYVPGDPIYAWYVGFDIGFLSASNKVYVELYVRAVRTGL